MSEVDLINFLDRWVTDHTVALEGEGIVAEFGRGDETRPKSMAYCKLETPEWIGELLLWSSGEVEIGATRTADGQEVNEHHHVTSEQDLASLLDRLRNVVTPDRS